MQIQRFFQRFLLVVIAGGLLPLLGATAHADDLNWQTPRIAHHEDDSAGEAQKETDSTRQAKASRHRPSELDDSLDAIERGIAPQRLRRGTIAARSAQRSDRSATRESRIASEVSVEGQETNGTVAYHDGGYASEPWHPHPSYPAYGRGGSRQHRSWGQQVSVPGRFEVAAGDEVFDGGSNDPWVEGNGFNSCGDCGNCDSCGPGLFIASASLGVQGFKGPTDLGRNGNFGVNESFNLGFPLFSRYLGGQFGARFVQSNFNGQQTAGGYSDRRRDQTFVTAGLFHRAGEWSPWQGGVVVDWFHDNYWYESDLAQMRFELSRVMCSGLELGIMATFGTGDDSNVLPLNNLTSLEATDMYSLFARMPTDNCGEWRFWGGATKHGDGLIGSDFSLPLLHSVALEGNFNYLFATESRATGQQEDSFGIGLNLTWYPGRSVRSAMASPFRPLFSVADNARFMVDRK